MEAFGTASIAIGKIKERAAQRRQVVLDLHKSHNGY